MNRPGFLLVIEGIDGAGKSTLARALAAWLRERGRTVIVDREPTDGPHGRALRESAKTGRLSAQAELNLFVKDRQQHVAEVIAPALERGDVVMLDRYYFSTAAYQGARGLDSAKIIAENEAFAPVPDLVLLLDLEPAAGHQRIDARGQGRDDFEGGDYLAEVRRIFLSMDRPFIHRLNAGRAPGEVLRAAVAILEAKV